MTNRVILKILLGIITYIFSGCGIEFEFSVHSEMKIIKASDGFPIVTYELIRDNSNVNMSKPRGVFFYIQGSEYETVLTRTDMLVSAVILGGRMIVYEKRGVGYSNVDFDTCYKYSSKQVRIEDGLKVIDEYIKGVDPAVPVILIGGSEGGDIASVMAARDKRITQLILLGSGGGWSQETELKVLLSNDPGYLGLSSEQELNSIINEIYNDSNELKLWAGHPFRRWKSYLRDSSITYLQKLSIPIILLHGDADQNVPVGSAREIKNVFENIGRSNITYVEYKNVDHRFYDTKRKISIYPKIEFDLIKWLYSVKVISSDEKDTFIGRVKDAHPDVFR